LGERGAPCRVVAIARDGKYNSLTEPAMPYIYFPLSQRFAGEAALLVRTRGDERPLAAAVRAELLAIDETVPALQIMTLDGQLRAATFVERAMAALVTALGALSVFLSTVGLYALASYVVRRRSRETGIRIALGAQPRDILLELIGDLKWPILVGLSAGVALAFAVASIAARSMYGVTARDPITYVLSSATLMIVVLAATLWPARGALQADPVTVLRTE
jgi:ABC-type antimicrobial peptide transport system permease subunit